MTTKAVLPQRHCRNITDHPAHTVCVSRRFGYAWCPGRVTPSREHRVAGSLNPAADADPFAGTSDD